MSYLEVLTWWLIPPTVLLTARAWQVRHRLGRRAVPALLGVALIALGYTTPWDNYLVWRGVWWYGEGRVLGTIGWVPVEEYVFFVLQPLFSGALYLAILDRFFAHRLHSGFEGSRARTRWTAFAFFGAALLSVGLLFSEPTLYLGLILVWTLPALGGMWLWGGPWLARLLAPASVTALLASSYLWVLDWYAIRSGVWTLSDRYTTGVALDVLPLEEAVFFLATNVLVVSGVTLFLVPGLHGTKE